MIVGSCRRGTTEISLHCILKCVLILQATDDLGELSTWDDGDNAWAAEAEEDLSWQAESTLRETRRQERENRTAQQKRKRQEKEDSRVRKDSSSLTAVRLS